MAIADTAPSIEEQYSTAVAAGLSDSRMIVAAGVTTGPGVLYARLRREWDEAHATIPQTVPATERRMLTAMRLKSLPEVKRILNDRAADWLERRDVDMDYRTSRNLVWLTISAWLDPNCPACDGRGRNPLKRDQAPGKGDEVVGAEREAGLMIACRTCRQTGKLFTTLGKGKLQEDLCAALLDAINGAVGHSRAQMRERKNARAEMCRWIEETR